MNILDHDIEAGKSLAKQKGKHALYLCSNGGKKMYTREVKRS